MTKEFTDKGIYGQGNLRTREFTNKGIYGQRNFLTKEFTDKGIYGQKNNDALADNHLSRNASILRIRQPLASGDNDPPSTDAPRRVYSVGSRIYHTSPELLNAYANRPQRRQAQLDDRSIRERLRILLHRVHLFIQRMT